MIHSKSILISGLIFTMYMIQLDKMCCNKIL